MADDSHPRSRTHDQAPRAIHDLVYGLNDEVRWEQSPGGCWSAFWRSLELRFVQDFGAGWVFDEVVGRCWIHIEQMDDPHYWMALHPLDERGQEYPDHARLVVDIASASGRALVKMTGGLD